MRYVTFRADNKVSYGLVQDGRVVDLGVRFGSVLPDLKSYLRATSLGLSPGETRYSTLDHAAADVTCEPVLSNPDKLLCVGLSYEEHRREAGRPEAEHPSIFTRFADTLIDNNASIVVPSVSSALDYEGELAAVIGKPGLQTPDIA